MIYQFGYITKFHNRQNIAGECKPGYVGKALPTQKPTPLYICVR